MPRIGHRAVPNSMDGHKELGVDFLIAPFAVAVLGIKPEASLQ